MVSRHRCAAAILAGAVVLAAPVVFCRHAPAELTPVQQVLAEKLLRDFTAPEFAVRQQAVDRLIAMGPDVRLLVEKTLAETRDAEVKMRCEMVLRRLAATPPATPATPELPPVAIDGSRVSMEFVNIPVLTALRQLGEKTGNRPLLPGYRAPGTQKVTVTVKDKLYWEAVDALCRAAGAVFDPSMGETPVFWMRGVEVKADDPRAYAGPAVVWVPRIERGDTPAKRRSFLTDQWFDRPDPHVGDFKDPGKVRVRLRGAVEDRFPVLECWAELTRATAGDARERPAQPLFERDTRKEVHWYPTYPGLGGDFAVDLPEGVPGPLTIEGVVHATFAVGRKEVRIEDVLSDEPKDIAPGGWEITLTSGRDKGDAVVFTLAVRKPGPEPALMGQYAPAGMGFTLIDPKGREYRPSGGFWGGRDRLFFRVPRVPEVEGAWSLVYAYPERVVRQGYRFRIDVPLP